MPTTCWGRHDPQRNAAFICLNGRNGSAPVLKLPIEVQNKVLLFCATALRNFLNPPHLTQGAPLSLEVAHMDPPNKHVQKFIDESGDNGARGKNPFAYASIYRGEYPLEPLHTGYHL